MIAEKQTKSANFLRIIAILKSLRDDGKISIQEYYGYNVVLKRGCA